MTKRKLTKHEDDIRRNLRKSAEINAPQSTHDGIHTCSKGCKKSGCNRGLRETIEEQDAQIEALKQDLKEQAAAVRHLRMERVHDLNHIGGLQEENADLKAEVERLKAVSIIEQRTIQGLQQTPEWSEIARLTAYCRELEGKVSHIDLFKSVVEKFFNSADLKNPLDAQSCYALAENLKQLPDSILDFTQEQVRDNPAWALAVFRHKIKEMQYKRIHDLNEIGGEQEENASLKAEVERLNTLCKQVMSQHSDISCENIMLRKAGDAMAFSIQFNEEMAQDYNGPTIVHQSVQRWNAAKEGNTP